MVSYAGYRSAFTMHKGIAYRLCNRSWGLYSKVGQGTFTPHRRKLIGDAFLKLKGSAFIRFTQEQIAITDEGRQFLSELELIASRRDDRSVKTAEINRELQAQPRARYIALLRECSTNLLASCIPRIKWFCQGRLAGAGHGFLMNGVRARDIALELWKGKVTPLVRSKAPTLVLILTRFSRVCCKSAQATANSLVNWQTQGGAALWKNGKVSWSSQNNKRRRSKPVGHACGGLAGRPVGCWERCSPFKQSCREQTRDSHRELTRASNSLVL